MLLDDFVMLGKAVPEPQDDGKLAVCSAGISKTLGLVRINPLAIQQAPARWSLNSVPLERDPKDNRHESWRIEGDNPLIHSSINYKFNCFRKITRESEKRELLSPYFVNSIEEANERKLSLALLNDYEIVRRGLYFKPHDDLTPRLNLFHGDLAYKTNAKQRFSSHPRLVFFDGYGHSSDRPHDIRIRDWGTFEWMRRWNEQRNDEIYITLHLDKPRTLFIGNMIGYRNSWLIISVLARIDP